MSYSLRYARIALLCVSAMLMSNLHAAPRCTTNVQVLIMAEAATTTTVLERTCRTDCDPAAAAVTGKTTSAPTHLPVVATPDSVADWHAQIYERLSQTRDSSEQPQYCQVDARLLF